MTSPPYTPASSSPHTAPDGALSTPCPPASARHSSRIASAPRSTYDSSIFIGKQHVTPVHHDVLVTHDTQQLGSALHRPSNLIFPISLFRFIQELSLGPDAGLLTVLHSIPTPHSHTPSPHPTRGTSDWNPWNFPSKIRVVRVLRQRPTAANELVVLSVRPSSRHASRRPCQGTLAGRKPRPTRHTKNFCHWRRRERPSPNAHPRRTPHTDHR